MRIVVLDGYTANPGDLDWQAFSALGELTVHDRTPPGQVVARAAGAEAILTNKTKLDATALKALPQLRYVGVLATGVNVVDLQAARAQGVAVTNVPAYGTASVAQATIALLMELANRVGRHDHAVHAGEWVASEDFCFTRARLTELDGLTLGIVGLGAIGQAVARVAQAFGMRVVAASSGRSSAPSRPTDSAGIERVPLDELFATADVISLHCPLTPENAGLVNAERLAKMKPTAFLLNTGRGGLIDEAALAAALRAGQLAGAGLDVLSSEPPAADNPLLSAPNCIITPHLAWATQAARRRLLATAAENLRAFAQGKTLNVVN